MAIKIKSAAQIAQKWVEVTATRGGDYKAGVEDSTVDWAGKTKAAESSYEEGLAASISKKSFGRGVDAAGNAAWKRGAIEKGVGRWPQGVRVAKDDYAKGYKPYRDVIASLVLPERCRRGDPRNYARVQALGEALHTKRISG